MATGDAVIQAVAAAARKRRLLTGESARRFIDYARSGGSDSPASLRAWLDHADGLSPDLAKRLGALLPPDDLPTFGAYRAYAHLADGGMGRVWLAAGPSDEMVVIKTIKSAGANDPGVAMERRQRFERELRITQRLEHPTIVRSLDAGAAADGTLYIVLEFIDTGDLRELVESRKRLAEPLALAVVHQIADALAEAHRLSLIHRDLKPSNVFVSNDGRAKLADFGLARSIEDARTKLTMAGALVGSPHYMSPEQIMAEGDLDGRSDLYALGAVLFYCLSGKTPFEGKVQDILRQHCQVPAPDVRTVVPQVSAPTAAIIEACLAKDPGQRPGSAAELTKRIEAALAALGVTVTEVIEEETHTADLLADHPGGPPPPHADDATMVADLSGGNAPGGAATGTFGTVGTNSVGTGSADLRAAILTSSHQRKTAAVDPGSRITIHEQPVGRESRTGSLAMQRVTASLLAADTQIFTPEQSAEAKTPGSGSGSSDLAPVDDATGARREGFSGDITRALADDWLVLASTTPGDQTLLHLWARPRLVLGKLKDPPVDLCLRNYPVSTHKEGLQKISRQHLALAFDRLAQQVGLSDLGTANGTQLDGEALDATHPGVLRDRESHVLVAAGVVSLWLRVRHARTRRAVHLIGVNPTADAECGLEIDHAIDAVVITRPENRPELAYAQVLRRLTVGGPGSDLALVGARSLAAVEIGRYARRWVWRAAGSDAWKPLAAGDELDCGGRRLMARSGAYDAF